MTGGINNPLGAKAIYLGNSLYRIHGTNRLELDRHGSVVGMASACTTDMSVRIWQVSLRPARPCTSRTENLFWKQKAAGYVPRGLFVSGRSPCAQRTK